MNSDRVFATVITTLIVGGFLCIGGVFVANCAVGAAQLTGASREKAQQEASAWAQEMGFEGAKVSCASRDSDGDGYVSCTIVKKDGSLVPVECAAALSFNDGCKIQRAGLVARENGQ